MLGGGGTDTDIQAPSNVPVALSLPACVEAVGSGRQTVAHWRSRLPVPLSFGGFVAAALECPRGKQQVCLIAQFQPGFTYWGSFAEYVGIHSRRS